MEDNKERLYKWTLCVGTLLWVIGLVLSICFEPMGRSVESQYFLSLSATRKWFWSILLFAIAIPFYIEGVFRYWGTGQRNKIIFSIVLIAMATAVICAKASDLCMYIASAISVLGLATTVFILLRNKGKKAPNNIFLLAVSTFIYLAYYASHVDSLYPTSVFGMVKLIGLSFVCFYLVANHGIIHAIGFHAINNIIVAIPLVVMGCQYKDIEVDANGVRFKIERVYTEETVDTYTDSQIILQGTTTDIAYMAMQQNENHRMLYVPSEDEGVFHFRLQASPEQRVNPSTVFTAMEKSKLITMDTSYEQLWMIGLPDSVGLDCTKRNVVGTTTVADLAYRIRYRYQIPIILESSLNPNIPIAFTDDEWAECDTFEDFVSHINGTCGIEINKLPYEKACIIKITTLK